MTRPSRRSLERDVDALADEVGTEPRAPDPLSDAESAALQRWMQAQFGLDLPGHGSDKWPYVRTEGGAIPEGIIQFSREAWPLSVEEAWTCLDDEEQALLADRREYLKRVVEP